MMPVPPSDRAFVAACAIAGALAVPADAVISPACALVGGLAGYLGLRLWRWSGLPGSLLPVASHGFGQLVRSVAWMGLGLLVGLLALAVIRLAIEPAVPAAGARIAAAGALPIWRRIVIIYVAAVGEELAFRLILLSGVSGVAMRLFRRAPLVPGRGIVWGSIGVSALAFGAVHLPAWNAVGPLSIGLACMVMALNGLAGVVLGYVFVTRGIVAAMWVHAGADCAIQLIGPLT